MTHPRTEVLLMQETRNFFQHRRNSGVRKWGNEPQLESCTPEVFISLQYFFFFFNVETPKAGSYIHCEVFCSRWAPTCDTR